MDNNGNGFTFRKSMRGFNKKDVIAYIGDENKRFMAEKSLLESKLAEAEFTISDSYRKNEEMKSFFDSLIDAKNKEIIESKAEADKLKGDLESANNRQNELLEESANLKTVLTGCEEQLSHYSDKIAELETENAILTEKAKASDDVKAENEYLREKYKALELEFRTLSEKLREIENSPFQYQSPRESKEDPFQKNGYNRSRSNQPPKRSTEAGAAGEKRTASGYFSEDTQQISDKAINSIKAINSDVQTYMNNCVGEFDSYSKDIISSLTSLVAEIDKRCKLLQDRIASHKRIADNNIKSRYNDIDK